MDEKTKPKSETAKYGKRPVWQWVVIYLVIAAVVYGLIYFIFMRDDGSGGGLNY